MSSTITTLITNHLVIALIIFVFLISSPIRYSTAQQYKRKTAAKGNRAQRFVPVYALEYLCTRVFVYLYI